MANRRVDFPTYIFEEALREITIANSYVSNEFRVETPQQNYQQLTQHCRRVNHAVFVLSMLHRQGYRCRPSEQETQFIINALRRVREFFMQSQALEIHNILQSSDCESLENSVDED